MNNVAKGDLKCCANCTHVIMPGGKGDSTKCQLNARITIKPDSVCGEWKHDGLRYASRYVENDITVSSLKKNRRLVWN